MKTFARSIFLLALAGCASAPTADPEAPSGSVQAHSPSKVESTSKPQPSAQPSTEGDGSDAGARSEPAAESDPRSDGLRKASRPPAELITNPSVLYVFNFNESAVGQTAQEQCSESTGGAKDQMVTCLQKARSKVPVESMRFVKKGKNEFWWITLNRYKGNLLKWHVIQFQVGDETADRVTLKPMGKDKGLAPMTNIPRTLEIELPNDYSIVVNDAEFGRMVLDAKIGAIQD